MSLKTLFLIYLVPCFVASTSLAVTIEPLQEISLETKQPVAEIYYTEFARYENRHRRPGRRSFIFDPRRLMWYAYDEYGRLVNSGRASGGRGYCADVGRRCRTPIGNFKVYRKGNAGCRSGKYPIGRGGAPMPHCMFFYKGYAIHGSPDVPNHNASHGCIRVRPAAARWLHRNFINHGTTVIVRPY